MVCGHILTGGGVQALPAAASAFAELLLAGGLTEIGGRAAHIVDIALKCGIFGHKLCFLEDALVASGLDDPSLMEGQSAERASTETAPVTDQAEFDLLNGGDAPELFVAGVVGTAVGEGVDCIHLLGGQGLLGRVLNYKFISPGFAETLGGEGVAVSVLNTEAFGISFLVFLQFFKGGEGDGGQAVIHLPGFKYCAVDVGNVPDIKAGIEGVRDFYHALFTHTVHQKIGLAVQQNGPLHTLRPVIVMGKPAEAGLDAANEDGDVLIESADQIAVDHGGVVRALAHYAAGGKGIGLAAVLADGVVVYHRVHIAAGNQKAQPRSAENIDGLGIFPIRLGNNAHGIAGVLQHTADNGVAKGGVIYISVTDHVDEIALRPAPVKHFLFRNGKKVHRNPPKVFLYSIARKEPKGKKRKNNGKIRKKC